MRTVQDSFSTQSNLPFPLRIIGQFWICFRLDSGSQRICIPAVSVQAHPSKPKLLWRANLCGCLFRVVSNLFGSRMATFQMHITKLPDATFAIFTIASIAAVSLSNTILDTSQSIRTALQHGEFSQYAAPVYVKRKAPRPDFICGACFGLNEH